MRCIFLHLLNTTEPEVAEFLQSTYPFQQGPPWIADIDGDACLYIDFYRDADIEFESEGWTSLVEGLGDKPTVSLIADVSGRHPGDNEVRSLVSAVLQKFRGVARDEYTKHTWTREEILSGQMIKGHPFFDYNGWYAEDRGRV